MIISLGTVVADHLEESIVIYPYQVSKVDQPDENDIREISEDST